MKKSFRAGRHIDVASAMLDSNRVSGIFTGGKRQWLRKSKDILKATPAPPVGPALGQHGVNIVAFTKEFNARTAGQEGMLIPVVITVYQDKSFSFITKTPPAAVLIKKACGIEHASGEPNKNKVATISKAKIQEIAETKMPDLNAASLEAAMSMIAGTARSMGVTVEE